MSGYEDSAERIKDKVQQLKTHIDNELAENDPWCEKSGLAGFYDT
jgi:hypothetical protein